MIQKRSSILLLAVAGALPLAAQSPSFEYDRSQPIGLAAADISLRNVTYRRASGGTTDATVVAPARAGRYPGVLFVHWYDGDAQSSNRTQFLPDALRLARQGVVSLLIDTMWSDPDWFGKRNPAEDLPRSIAQVKDLRRALDVLGSLKEVDPSRVAYVGHDFGAMYGAVVASVDRRPKAWVFVAGTTAFADWYTLGRKLDADARQKVEAELSPLDPIRHVAQMAPAPVLFQFATKDPYVTRAAADALVAAAVEPKTALFYDCGHAMNRDAMDARIEWLLRTLKPAADKR